MSRPHLKPNWPIIVIGVASSRMETANRRLAAMCSWVKFCLLMLTATVGGSEVTWNTVFAIWPLNRPYFPEVIT
jgi:hypothetical protein